MKKLILGAIILLTPNQIGREVAAMEIKAKAGDDKTEMTRAEQHRGKATAKRGRRKIAYRTLFGFMTGEFKPREGEVILVP